MYLSLVSSPKGTLILKQFDGSPIQPFSYEAGSTAFTETHRYRDDNPSGTGSDIYAITAMLADDDSGSETGIATVIVNNVAPVIKSLASIASNVGDAREGEPVTISGVFTDIGTLDTHSGTIDWGDGTTSKAVITEKDGSGLLSGSHKYYKLRGR